jgi:hypothetical protein
MWLGDALMQETMKRDLLMRLEARQKWMVHVVRWESVSMGTEPSDSKETERHPGNSSTNAAQQVIHSRGNRSSKQRQVAFEQML